MDLSGFWAALGRALGAGKERKGWLGVLADAVLRWLKPRIRGTMGERVLEGRLRVAFAGSGAVVFGPFMLRRADGEGTSEVDGLVIARNGIFVIEVKTYLGAVEGKIGDEDWVHILGRRRRKFQNPLRQNYGHMKDVKRIVGKELEGAVHGLVAFSGESEFRGERPSAVMDFGEVADYVKRYRKGRRLAAGEIGEVKGMIDAAIAEVTPEEKKRHVERVKERRARARRAQ